jgi:tRNA-splicing ligase RtcB
LSIELLAPRGGDPADPSSGPRIFESEDAPADPRVLALLERGLDGADLAAPPVVLPDFYHKSAMELPSSIAVATRERIWPTLTSASVNCGMALMAFDMERPSPEAVERFYGDLRQRFPFPKRNRVELTAAEVLRCAVEGAAFSAGRFGVDPGGIDRMEEYGRLDLEPYGGVERARKELSPLAGQLARLRFGNVGPSTHFVELQTVEEVLDPPVAERLGLRKGQVTLQYHGGDGILNVYMGSLFGRRKSGSRAVRTVMALEKPLAHLTSARSLREARARLALYFSGGCPPIPRFGEEGQRWMLANAMAMNYGFAYRLASYATFDLLARRTLGATAAHLVVDSPHNSVYEEEVGGEVALVHRHNSCRAYPASMMGGHPVFAETGQPVLLPGTNRTASYLCVGAEAGGPALFSACHGSGTLIDLFQRLGRSGPDPQGRTTLKFSYSDSAPAVVGHLDERGVDEALKILVDNGLVKPVARLRPFAVLT